MQTSALRLPNSAPAERPGAPTKILIGYASEWIDDGKWRGHSEATADLHKQVTGNLLWFLKENDHEYCGTPEIRQFLSYLKSSHNQKGGIWHGVDDPPGRWGNRAMIKPVRKGTVHTYHGRLKTWFTWLVKQEYIAVSPMDKLATPDNKRDQIQPFTEAQVTALVAAARATRVPLRDEAIVWLLFDTGIRAAELCELHRKNLDMVEKRISVLGKGNKRRTVYFGVVASKALWNYLRAVEPADDDPLFPSSCGPRKGECLTRYSLGDMIEALGVSAGLQGVRCSPHTFRHTFAINFLRGGGQAFALKEILGHENLTMTNRYTSLAEADLANQRRFSPADRLVRPARRHRFQAN